jgi:putative ABC transport system permease protein
MISSNLKLFLKFLAKNKLYTTIIVFSFSIALAYIILIGVYVKNELSVDSFHTKKERLFRLQNDGSFAPKVGPWLMEKFPEIENYTRYDKRTMVSANPGGLKQVSEIALVDSSFFTMFSFKMFEGDPNSVLDSPKSIVLSKKFANKLFGNKPAIGKEIILGDTFHYIVSGVVDDFKNTQFEPCDAIVNFTELARMWNYPELLTTLDNSSFNLYFLERKGTDLASKAPEALKLFKKDYWMYTKGIAKELEFIPLTKSYYYPVMGHGGMRSNNLVFIRILIFIALFVLVIALLNYVNLSIAQSGFRAKEAALKKMAGSSKEALLLQFVSESVLLCLLSFGLAIGLAILLEPYAGNLLSTRLNLPENFTFLNFSIGIVFIIVLGIIAGIAPALIISKFSPIDIVKGSFRRSSKLIYSKALISFQYFIALVLLICTMVIVKQTRFMLNYNVGFDKENIAYFENPVTDSIKVESFIHDLKKNPGIEEVSFVQGCPIDAGNNNTMEIAEGKTVGYQTFTVDSAYIKMMKLKVTSTGAAYSKYGILMNETALKESGLNSHSQTAKWYREKLPLLGVTNDYLISSLHEKVRPAVIFNLKKKSEGWTVLVKLSGSNLPESISHMRKVYKSYTDGLDPDIKFFDQTIEGWYTQEKNTSRLIGSFTILAIVMSVMGLFAMSLYYIQQKTKEIGLRKISGASEAEITNMLNRDYTKWVVIAFAFAVPISWYIMHRWLESFPYKTNISWWIFAIAGISALLIALLTIGWQSWKAATRNPVEALRYE